MNIRSLNLTCPHCGSSSFVEDEEPQAPRESDARYFLKCLTCSRSYKYNPQNLPAPRLPDDGTRYTGKSLATISAEQRYRNSELYRATRRRHDRTYRQSEKGRETINKRSKERREEDRMREGILRRLEEQGLM